MIGAVRVLLAPDKFKGSLSAREVADALADGIAQAAPDWQVVSLPVADGGDGLIDAVSAAGFTVVEAQVTGSLGDRRTARYALRGTTGVVELAEADGLRHLDPARLSPLKATSAGVGELVRHALDDGCTTLVVGLGGSANTDGGSGLLRALGARLTDAGGAQLPPGGGPLGEVHEVDLSGLDPRLAEVELIAATDVDNPLLGPHGTAAVYAPQKGADDSDVAALDAALARWSQRLGAATGREAAALPGAGAAGGVGFALLSLGARVRPGIEVVMDLLELESALAASDLVVVGEGSLDAQSLRGKAPVGVSALAGRHGIPVVAVAGRSTLTADELHAAGIHAVLTLRDLEPDPAVSMRDAAQLLRALGRRLPEIADSVTPPGSPPG